jgi:hypothetical protein
VCQRAVQSEKAKIEKPKGDGSGNGSASTTSPLKFDIKEGTNAWWVMSPSRKAVNHGPNRRHINVWVPVERRECKL